MMAYALFWKPKALEDIESLDPLMQKRIVEKIELLGEQPQRFLEYVKKYGVHKLRVGDYRIFIDLHPKDESLEVLTIRHGKKAYKKL